MIKCRSLNNNYRKFECIESFIQALPNIAEILQAEVENPLPTNKHDLVAAYTTKFHAELTNFLSISLHELEDIYKKVHHRHTNLVNTPNTESTDTNSTKSNPYNILERFITTSQHPIQKSMSSITDTTTTKTHSLSTTIQHTESSVTPDPLNNEHHTPKLPTPTIPTHKAHTPVQNTINQQVNNLNTNTHNPPTMLGATTIDTLNPTIQNAANTPTINITNPFANTNHNQTTATPVTLNQASLTTTQNPIIAVTNPYQTDQPKEKPHNPDFDTPNKHSIHQNIPHKITGPAVSNSYTDITPTQPLRRTIFDYEWSQDALASLDTEEEDNMPHITTPNDIKQKPDDATTPKAPNQSLTIPPDHPLISRLHEAILACFINAQASYITKYSHNAISLNLKRVAIKQRLENSANQTASLLAAEQHAPPKTITAVIDK